MSAYTRRKAKSKYRDRIRLERDSQKQLTDPLGDIDDSVLSMPSLCASASQLCRPISVTSPPLTPARRKSKTQAERQREYRLRLKQKILNNGEKNSREAEYRRQYRLKKKMQKAQNINGDKPAKKTRADYQREYRLRKKLRAELNSASAEIIPRQTTGPSGYLAVVTTAQLMPSSPDAGPHCLTVNIKDERDDQFSSSETSATHSNRTMKKQKLSIEDTSDDDMCTSGTGDKYDALGKHIASEVRQLGEQQRMLVERIIYEVINAGRNGSLNVRSKLVVNSELCGSEASDDDEIMSLQDEEINLEEDAGEIKVHMDDPTYLSGGSSDGVVRESACNLVWFNEKIIGLKKTAEMSQPPQEDEVMYIKVEPEAEEDASSIEQSELPLEEIFIKQEIKIEDENLLENLKTEFIINKQQSLIEVYRSSDAKRKRMDKAGEAKIHLELLKDPNVKI